MGLKEVAKDMWCAQGDLFMPGKIHFPVRMVVVRVDEGSLCLHSPIALDEETIGELKALGEVKWIIAPNKLHHLYVEKAKEAFPDALLYGAPGLEEKRKDIDFDHILDEDKCYPWSSVLQHKMVKGAPEMNEFVFFHELTQTLIVTDLVFHIQGCQNWRSVLLFRLVGAYRRLSQSRLWRLFTKDRNAAGASVREILSWDFKRVVMAHGAIVEGDDLHERMSQGLSWMLRGDKILGRPQNTTTH